MGRLGLAPSLLVFGVSEWQHLELGRCIALPEFVYAKSTGWPAVVDVTRTSFGFGDLKRLRVSSRRLQGFQARSHCLELIMSV